MEPVAYQKFNTGVGQVVDGSGIRLVDLMDAAAIVAAFEDIRG